MVPTDLVTDYNAQEQAALRRLPNRIIEAAQPAAFHYVNYPTRISDHRELWRYAEVMQDRRAEKLCEKLGGLTFHEFQLWAKATEYAAALTEEFGHRVVPRNAPLAAVPSYRAIVSFYDDPAIFEVGPGCGYLGKMLLLDGKSYRSTDVTQAFSIWQATFLGSWQIPWWQWFDYNKDYEQVNAIVVNHALCELSENALRYLIVRAETMLVETGAIFAEGFGAHHIRNQNQTVEIFSQRGWNCFAIAGDSYVFLPPLSKGLPARKPLEARTCQWKELESVWEHLGAQPIQDDEFLDFIGSTIDR
jgi:hypothetical protein